MAIVIAIDMYAEVSSLVLWDPGNIQGTLMRNAKMISTDLCRCDITLVASVLAWPERRFDSAEPDGQNSAADAMIEVVRNADRDWVYAKVYIRGSRPHLVCANLSLKLEPSQ